MPGHPANAWREEATRWLTKEVGHAVGDDARRLVAAQLEQHRIKAEDKLTAARDRVAVRRDPVRKHERRKRWARRSVIARGVVTFALAWVTFHVGPAPGLQADEVLWGTAASAAAVSTVGAGRRLWRLERTVPPPAPPRPAPLPPPGSASRPALQHLAEREQALHGLLVHLGADAAEPRSVAAAAATALRALGARVDAVDTARRGAPPEAAECLAAGLAVLVRQLDDGVAAFEALVVAAADAVSAGATLASPQPLLTQRLGEATDTLAGLAAGLRAVTG